MARSKKLLFVVIAGLLSAASSAWATKPWTPAMDVGKVLFSSTDVHFDALPVGERSQWVTLAITNGTDQPVTFTSIVMSQGQAHFEVKGRCPVLSPKKSCSIRLAFTPTAEGMQGGTVLATYANGAAATSLPVAGLGISPADRSAPR